MPLKIRATCGLTRGSWSCVRGHQVAGWLPAILRVVLLPAVLSVFSTHAAAQNQTSAAMVLLARGDVKVLREGSKEWIPARPRMNLFDGDIIRTGGLSGATLAMADESVVKLHQNSRLQLRAVARSAGWYGLRGLIKTVDTNLRSLYSLQAGRLFLRNKNRAVDAQIETAYATTAIRGTEIDVLVEDGVGTTVTVLEGTVQTFNDFGAVDAASGEAVFAAPGTAPVKRVLVNPEDAVQWTLVIPPRMLTAMQQASANASTPESLRGALVLMLAGEHRAAAAAFAQLPAEAAIDRSVVRRYEALNSVLLGETATALEEARDAVQLEPASADALLVQAYAQQAAFDLDAAEASNRQALALEPGNAVALVNLARLEFGDDRTRAARQTLDEARVAAPADPDALTLSGFVALAERRLDDATDAFRRALETEPGSADAYLGLGLIAMRQGDEATALESVTYAVALEPQRGLYMSYWGKMLYQLRRFEKALDVFGRAEQLDPRDPTPVFYRAIILRDLNRQTESIREMSRAVALNDNRAVYRSRFLMDQDLAVRSVDLSMLYAELGLNAWSRRQAVNAVKADYTNYSAHLSLAGTMENEPDRAFPFANEQLLARLLQPANVNAFNSFNEYTSLLEQPGLDGVATVRVGNFGQRATELVGFGYLPEANLAWQMGGFYDDTDGWRGTDFERSTSLAAIAKWQATQNSGVLLSVSSTHFKQGDEQFRRFEASSPSDPLERNYVEQERYELGYHYHAGPHTDLMAYFTYFDQEITQRDHGAETVPIDLGGNEAFLDFDGLSRVEQDQPLYQGQLQLAHRWGAHQLLLGGLYLQRDVDVSNTSVSSVLLRVPALDFSNATSLGEVFAEGQHDFRFASVYVQDVWSLTDSLTLDLSVYFDRLEDGETFGAYDWTVDRVDPRAGLIWQPTSADTLRLAAFRYLLPFSPARLDPSDVAGVGVIRNTNEGARVTEYDLVWEHDWGLAFTSVNVFRLQGKTRQDSLDGNGAQQINYLKSEQQGVDVEWNQLLGVRFAWGMRYTYQDIEDDGSPSAWDPVVFSPLVLLETDREEQLVTGGLRYVHPSGFSGGVSYTHKHLNLRAGRDDEHVNLVDLDASYLIPGRRGELRLEIRNLLDDEFDWVTDRFIVAGRSPAREVLGSLSVNF